MHARMNISTEGHRIVGEHGEEVSLAGNSFFWSQWEGEFWNAECVEWLKTDWKASVVRAAMGVEADSYLANPDKERARVETVVDAATKIPTAHTVSTLQRHCTARLVLSASSVAAAARLHK